jgi:hypothetical protein
MVVKPVEHYAGDDQANRRYNKACGGRPPIILAEALVGMHCCVLCRVHTLVRSCPIPDMAVRFACGHRRHLLRSESGNCEKMK